MKNINTTYNSSDKFSAFSKKYFNYLSDIQKNFNGDFICFIQSGDKLSKNALFKITYFINNNPDSDLIYTDHDFFDGNNLRTNPFFKPDWSPILFQSVDYLSTFFIVKKDIFNLKHIKKRVYIILSFLNNTYIISNIKFL